MNKFDLTNKANGYQRSADELDFIMNEMFMSARAFMNMLFEIAAPTDIIIMSGCVVDDSAAPDFTMTAGYAYHQGEVFALDAAAFTAAGGQTAVFVLEATDVNLTFQDTASYKAREVRKLKLQSGVAGTGLKDYGAVVMVNNLFRISGGALNAPTGVKAERAYSAKGLVSIGPSATSPVVHDFGTEIAAIYLINVAADSFNWRCSGLLYNAGTFYSTADFHQIHNKGGMAVNGVGDGGFSITNGSAVYTLPHYWSALKLAGA